MAIKDTSQEPVEALLAQRAVANTPSSRTIKDIVQEVVEALLAQRAVGGAPPTTISESTLDMLAVDHSEPFDSGLDSASLKARRDLYYAAWNFADERGPTEIEVTGGPSQTEEVEVGSTLLIGVKVRDRRTVPVPVAGVRVTFEPSTGSQLAVVEGVTDGDGRVGAAWRLLEAGRQSLVITAHRAIGDPLRAIITARVIENGSGAGLDRANSARQFADVKAWASKRETDPVS